MYPAGPTARDEFVVARRPDRAAHDPWSAHAVVVEHERTETGDTARVATVFLTGRECPWRCAMCDLWQYTTTSATPPGAIAAQVTAAVRHLDAAHPDVTRLKLYNAGSFFDPHAVPDGDYEAVARAVSRFDRVVVESHPALIGPRTDRLLAALRNHRDALPSAPAALEVAMGLETVHPLALERLNKRMTVSDYTSAASRLAAMGVALRAFLLVSPPFVPPDEQDEWMLRSVDSAVAAGASVVSLIPTRGGNGAIETLEAEGLFAGPHLQDLERSTTLALGRRRPARVRIFADVWDLDRFASCPACLPDRRRRLETLNLEQRSPPPVVCARCDGGPAR